jgi:predicted TIM-barrel fold metal-dependent hydrolase
VTDLVIATKVWANSGDSHYIEPPDLYATRLPGHLAERMPRTVADEDGEWETVYIDAGSFRRKIPTSARKRSEGGETIGELNARPPGSSDPVARLKDLDGEGIWGEVVYPSVGLWHSMIHDPELLGAAVRVSNDYVLEEIQAVSPRLVAAGQLPLLDVDDAVGEVRRCASRGFHAISVAARPPGGRPAWTHPTWEPLWTEIEESGMVLTVHIGTDKENLDDLIAYRGNGGAVLNYVDTSFGGMRIAAELVASGALDRHPGIRLLISEGGASWVPFLGDRMDEAYRQHGMFVRPALSASPKEILYRQVYASFQHDVTAVAAHTAMGYRNVVWGSDYPHIEGTFGHTQATLHQLFDEVSDAQRHRMIQGAFYDLFPMVGPPPSDS